MADIVAKIQLAHGERSYFDEISDTYLNQEHPIKDIVKGTDCTNLRKAVKARHIRVIAGSLGTPLTFKEVLMTAKSKRTGESLQTLMGDTPLHKEPEDPIDTENTTVVKGNGESMKGFESAANTHLFSNSTPVGPAIVIEPELKTSIEENNPVEEKEAVTAKPASIRSLKVNASRDIELNYAATGAISENENIAKVETDGMKVSVTGITAGKTEIIISTENGDITVPVTVTEA